MIGIHSNQKTFDFGGDYERKEKITGNINFGRDADRMYRDAGQRG